MSTPLLQAIGLSKSFAGIAALQQVDFELRAGEVHALMGENGAGKSTLMKLLAGIHAADAGELLLEGQALKLHGPADAQRCGISIVHQELNLVNALTVAQNLYLGREPRRWGLLDNTALRQQARALFERLGFGIHPDAPVAELSVAQQQLVEIAKALSFDARVLILDEPTAALEQREVEQLFTVLRQLRARGMAIVYVSHKMAEIRQIADRVTVLRDGRRVGSEAMHALSDGDLIRLMVGRTLDDTRPARQALGAAEPALELRHFGRGRRVQDISLSIRPGEVLGLAGLMGAGRTELARAVFGADGPVTGELLRHGRPVRIATPQQAVEHGIAYLSEDRKQLGLAVDLDLASNLTLSSLPSLCRGRFWVDDAAVDRASQRWMRELHIKAHSPQQVVKRLSGGNQQKVAIAKWLQCDCEVLMLDEPTRGVDIGAKLEIYQLIEALAAQGKAVLLISSELPELLRLSHRIAVMCEGRLTGIVDAAEATQERLMELATRHQPATDLPVSA